MMSRLSEDKSSKYFEAFLMQGIHLDGKGWLIELGASIASWYLGDPLILLTTAAIKGGVDLYRRFLNCMDSANRKLHSMMRNVSLAAGIVLTVPLLVREDPIQNLIYFLVNVVSCFLIFILMGCTNSPKEAKASC